jgi:hypothetical protein
MVILILRVEGRTQDALLKALGLGIVCGTHSRSKGKREKSQFLKKEIKERKLKFLYSL